ncbi:thiamine phosphate synthase [Timonella sp. A28]|uniref:thiamine phosphate synthase n=1 Tax=Timonella sp. A28 TaxID=3442640 RepID=UPI003EB96571
MNATTVEAPDIDHARLMQAGKWPLYLVTDAQQCARQGRSIAHTVRLAVRGGVTAVQIRAKDVGVRDFLHHIEHVSSVIPEHVSFIINDRVDVFLAARELGFPVSGVHLGQSDLPASVVRKIIGPQAFIGLSVREKAGIRAAEQDSARIDYLGIGPVFTTTTKHDVPSGLGVPHFAELVHNTSLPVVAIGGIRARDAQDLRRAGAQSLAVVSGLCDVPDPEKSAQEYLHEWEKAV